MQPLRGGAGQGDAKPHCNKVVSPKLQRSGAPRGGKRVTPGTKRLHVCRLLLFLEANAATKQK